MSLKYAAQKVGPNHWVLPQTGSMRVEAHAYLSDSLYAASDEQLWQQIMNGASYPGVIGAYLMPDTHVGYGVPVGSALPAAPVFQVITMRSGMAADKSTEKIINFTLPDPELGNLEKLELRMIFFIKTNASENDWRFTRRQSVNL